MVEWTLRLDEPEAEMIWVGVTAIEYMSVTWAVPGCQFNEGLGWGRVCGPLSIVCVDKYCFD